MAARVGGAIGVFRPFLHVRFGSYEGRDYSWGLVGLWMYWALVPLAVAGAVINRRRGRDSWPLLVPCVMVLAVTAVVYGSIRFRLAAEVPLIALAALAVDRVLPSGTGARR
jgi:hypothetical protein